MVFWSYLIMFQLKILVPRLDTQRKDSSLFGALWFLIFCRRAERKDHHWIIQKSFLLYYIIAGFFFCVIESSVYHAQWVQTKHTRFKGRKIGENTTNDSVSETWYLLKKRLLKLSQFFLFVGKSNILLHHDTVRKCQDFSVIQIQREINFGHF